ncbi:MAG: coiled coil domain-containing protein [Gammaproteobacteria bacterium]|nr:coiled coil domain-containing protein [Gammaproteobacteria bacterium]
MGSRNAYEQKVQARLERIRAEIRRLQAKAREADADTHIGMEEQAAQLDARREAVLTRLALLRDAGDETLAEVKAGLEAALQDLEDAFEAATAKFEK